MQIQGLHCIFFASQIPEHDAIYTGTNEKNTHLLK